MSWKQELAIEGLVVLVIALWLGKGFVGAILSWFWALGWIMVMAVCVTVILAIAVPMLLAHKRRRNQ